jgi:hypothetical protein
MYLIQKVSDRQKGMGMRITKFHAITPHMSQDILHFGAPLCFDTGPDEAMHKPTNKVAAKVTQKRKELFDEQVGQRMMELHTLQLAMAESNNRTKVHGSCYGITIFKQNTKLNNQPIHHGPRIHFDTPLGLSLMILSK